MTGAGAPAAVLATDLDGTLLDDDYRPGPAAEALRSLQAAGVLVVFNSSKTRAEQEPLRRSLSVRGPFIVENGSAVLLPPPCDDLPRQQGYGAQRLGLALEELRPRLRAALGELGLAARGFASMDDAEVAEATGLGLASARLARRREYSETLVGLDGPSAERLAAALERRGLALRSGGRHHTVTGGGADKGRALVWLMGRLRRLYRAPALLAVAVGDGANDVGMLASADRGYLVARRDGAVPEVEGVERLSGVGPEGFAELARRLLETLRTGNGPRR